VLRRVSARLAAEHGEGAVRVPGRLRAHPVLAELSRGTNAFTGGAVHRHQAAGRLRAAAADAAWRVPGHHPAGRVRDKDPVTLRWVQAELTIAMDLYDRCITGLRLTPVSTKAIDAAAVLFGSVRPLPEPAAGWMQA
jgi:transposase InsO family protein